MTSELAIKTAGAPAITNMDDLVRVSDMLAKSGYFTDATSAAQAGVKVLAGLELGIPAFSAMSGIHIVKGKPTLGANLIAARVKASGKYDYRVKEMTDDVCTIVFLQGGEEIGVSTFTKQDAARAGTQNMGKFPRNMLFARSMSNGVKWFAPDIFLAPIYTPEEMGLEVDAEGDVITVEVVEQPVSPPEPVQETPKEPVEAKAKPPPLDGLRAEFIRWAFDQKKDNGEPIFNAVQQAANSYDKLKREYLNNLEPSKRPTMNASEEEKAAHHQAVNGHWLKKVGAYERGDDYSLPPYEEGARRVAAPFDANEAVGVEALS